MVSDLLGLIEARPFDCLYTHWRDDGHLDHRALALASLSAARHLPRILMYRSNSYVSGRPFDGRFYVDVSEHMETKLQALRAHRSEVDRLGEAWLAGIEAENRRAGHAIAVEFAECFEVAKYLW